MSVDTHSGRVRRQAAFSSIEDKEPQMLSVATDRTPQSTERPDGPGTSERLLLVDDHPAVRAGLRDVLEDQPDFEVVAAVATAEEALAVAEGEPIDVAVVDYQLQGRNGLWVSRKLKRLPEPPGVLIYSAYADGVLISAAVVAEADAIVSKGGLGAELCDAIRSVARGRQLLPPVPHWLGDALRRRLDHEEQAIFGMLLAGIKPAEIAETLGLSEVGLESRLWSMLRRLESGGSEQAGPYTRLPGRRPSGR
jgi:DNA-binding NarL/FixJ family response regulator